VEDNADMADILRLTVGIGVNSQGTDWTVIGEGTLTRLTKVEVGVTLGPGRPEPLIEAYVIEARAHFSNVPNGSTLEIVAMDATALMNLEERVRPWPNMSDSTIATEIFSEHRMTADVDQTSINRQEDDVTTIQRGTDIQFLRRLARRNGFECFVESDPVGGQVRGHFHAPRLGGSPQGVLTVNMGEETNVDSFQARYNMLGPAQAVARGVDVDTGTDQSGQASSVGLDELGTQPSLAGPNPRTVILSGTGLMRSDELQAKAQAFTDQSGWAITAEGEVNSLVYEGVIRAKRPIKVRGVGRAFSGTYYVDRVLHLFIGNEYRQRFSLRRNASGVPTGERFVEGEMP